MWFDIIKTDISALLDDLQNTEGLEVPELIEEIQRLKDTREASENLSQPLMEESKTYPSMSDIVEPFDEVDLLGLRELVNTLEPIVEDRKITPEEAQQIANKKEWQEIVQRNKYPALINLVNSTKQSRIRQV
jgi:hypothetical protein